jgi:molybdopterin-containing oxidoreductase family membrane subunit
MWIERFLIIVPTLGHPRLPFNWRGYTTTWTELSIAGGAFAYFLLLYALFTKVFPIVAVWEFKEGLHIEDKAERVQPAIAPSEIRRPRLDEVRS